MIATIAEKKKFSDRSDHMETGLYCSLLLSASPFINLVFGRLCRKTVSRGREDTRVLYRETMFSQQVSYDFPFHGPLQEYFLYLVSSIDVVHEQLISTIYEQSILPVDKTMAEDLIVSCSTEANNSVADECQMNPDVKKRTFTSERRDRLCHVTRLAFYLNISFYLMQYTPHPFAHHYQHARNNSQHCWRCCVRFHAA